MLIAQEGIEFTNYSPEREQLGLGLIPARKAKLLKDEIGSVTH